MDIKQDQAIKRLLKKLSALRATLNNDERDLLDGLITGPVDEVGAHSMKVIPISSAKSTAKATSPDETKALSMHANTAKSTAKATSPDETKALSMHANTAKSTAKATSPDETKALSMHANTAKSTAKATSPDETKALSMSVQIIYDQTKGEYQRLT